jgi:peroxiredoxin Q/BCP
MARVKVGSKVGDFTLPATGDGDFRLSDCKGSNVVVYFYPKDCTPGCTIESQDFRDHVRKFRTLNTVIVGVSRDNISSHENFKSKEKLPFELVSDTDQKLCRQFDVIREKNMYGKKVMGIERSTFLIDGDGVLRREWRKVKVDGHVAEVLAAVKEL